MTNELVQVGELATGRQPARHARQRTEQLTHLIELLEAHVQRLHDVGVLASRERAANKNEIRTEARQRIGDFVEDPRGKLAHRRLLFRFDEELLERGGLADVFERQQHELAGAGKSHRFHLHRQIGADRAHRDRGGFDHFRPIGDLAEQHIEAAAWHQSGNRHSH